jgi:hypothetical protein
MIQNNWLDIELAGVLILSTNQPSLENNLNSVVVGNDYSELIWTYNKK